MYSEQHPILKTIPRALWIPREQTAEIWLDTEILQREGRELLEGFGELWRAEAAEPLLCLGTWPRLAGSAGTEVQQEHG